MEFGAWYQINCGSEDEWKDDLALMKDSGFDFVVFWYLIPPPKDESTGGDWRLTYDPDMVLRILDEAEKAGLQAYLGVWHPYNMGDTPMKYRLVSSTGENINGPDLFNEEWLKKVWSPYLKQVAGIYKEHKAYKGLYFDDTFPVVIGNLTSYQSYSEAAAARFRRWLEEKYGSVESLNIRYKLYNINGGFKSFNKIHPPKTHEENLSLWMDWTSAREDWCEDFARITKEAYRSADPDPEHLLVLSDQDYHMHSSIHHYGVNYTRLMKHFDRLEIYMAPKFDMLPEKDLLSWVEDDVKTGRKLAGKKTFQFHTWFNEPVDYKLMSPEMLQKMIECAAKGGAEVIEIYAFKMRDWRVKGPDKPLFKEISLVANPEMLNAVKKTAAKLKKQFSIAQQQ